jgi:microcystin synthetase protein McyB
MNSISVKTKEIEPTISASSASTTARGAHNVADCYKGGLAEGKCVHELFQEQAEYAPAAFAVIDGDRCLSYRELNHRSNQLAYKLRELGVGPEVLVAIYMQRSLEMIVGMLGILKAGGAYVPMDSAYPAERLAFVLEDAQAPVLLTTRSLSDRLPKTSASVVHLDDWKKIDGYSTSAPANLVSPTNLVYVIYTSDSIGEPKGVLVEHAGLANLADQHRNLYGDREGIRISQIANACFDSMGTEIWPALLSGATLCIAPNEVQADPERLQRWLIEQRIVIAFATTVVAERLLALSWREESAALRVLRFGGEPSSGRQGHRYYPFYAFNEYGPTEDTGWTTVAAVVEASASEGNIGHPIVNHQVYVLDRNQNPVPEGEVGELYIGGVGLARGYLNRPELTAEKFIPSAFSESGAERLYRTGDLVRCLPDDSLAFLGHIDEGGRRFL